MSQPGRWVMVRTLIDDSGLPAVLDLTSPPAVMGVLIARAVNELRADKAAAIDEAVIAGDEDAAAWLRRHPVVLNDLGGHPCAQAGHPIVTAWLARLAAHVARLETAAGLGMEASRRPACSEIEAAALEAVSP